MKFPCLLPFDEVELAPPRPGLYAWYGRIYSPPGDYKRELDDSGKDLGDQRFRELLAKHMLRFQLAPFELRGRGHFGVEWRGTMQDQNRDNLQDLLLARVPPETKLDEEQKGFAKNLSSVTKDERRRALLAKLLTEVTPLLTAPIYVGVTKNLRIRLCDHTKLYRDLQDGIGSDKSKLEALQRKVEREGLEFAHRAIASDFSPDHLCVAILDVSDLLGSDLSDEELRQLSGVAEWLVNRWHRPFVGRR